MKLLIVGATRGIGLKLLEFSVAAGHEVTVLARNPEKTARLYPGARFVKGDILDSAIVSEAVAGQDAVCLCIGIPPTRKAVALFSRGTANVLAAIGDNPAIKVIAVTGIGAGDSKGHGGFFYDKIVNPLLLKTIYEDKDRQEALLQESSCQWLIVRPAMLTNGPRTGNYRVIDRLQGITSRKISRADVADFILAQLNNLTHFGRTPLITY